MPDLLERLTSALADRYAVESEIGRGGMAVVFIAEDLRHGRKVAIKVLHPELSATLAAERFLNEIQIVAGLTHPHILALHESGEVDGLLYYVMPYVPGESLRQRLEREGQLPVAEAVRITVEVADGLDFAHRQGVIHRDVKPGNILISDKHAVITDFGIARAITKARAERVTSTGLAVGTPLYASPEQATGAETLDGRTDIYSLACVLYEMLAGEVPLTGPTPQATQVRRAAETPSPLHTWRESVPPLLDQAMAKALARLPADRWGTAEMFSQALMTATMDVTPVARLDLATTPGLAIAAEDERKGPRRWAIGTAVLAVVVVGGWFLVRQAAFLTGSADEAGVATVDKITTETRLDFEGKFGEALTQGSEGAFGISPDGQQLAYCTLDAEDQAVRRLWLADLSDPDRAHRELISAENCVDVRWTPSGDRILFRGSVLGRQTLWSVAPHDGSATPFLDCPMTAFRNAADRWIILPNASILSPDEAKLVFNAVDVDHFRVGVSGTCEFAEADSFAVVLGDGYGRMWPRAWSPQGDRILLITEEKEGVWEDLWTVATDGTDPQRVADGGLYHPISWPDPGHALYHNSPQGITRIRLSPTGAAVGEPEPLAHFEGNPIRWFSLSADGQTAVVVRQVVQYRIVRVIPDRDRSAGAAVIVPVTDTVAGFGAFSVSRDGRWIAFGEGDESGTGDLFKVPVEGGRRTRLTSSGVVDIVEGNAWSPGDSFVAFAGMRNGVNTLWLASSDGRSSGFVRDVSPDSWNPDPSWLGSKLHFVRTGDLATEIVRDIEIEYGQWYGDVFRSAPAGAPPTNHFVAKAEREVLHDPEGRWRYGSYGGAYGSPDDSTIVTRCSQTGSGGDFWCLVSRDDSTRMLANWSWDDRPIGWTEDGGALYWRTGRDLNRWPLDGDKELLVTLPEGLGWIKKSESTGSGCQPRWGVDDIEFICAIDETYTDLFLVENFDPDVN